MSLSTLKLHRQALQHCQLLITTMRMQSPHQRRRAPVLCCVTPRKAEDPRVKPWLCRRMAITSSLMGTWSRQSSSGAYLRAHQCKV